MIIILNGRAGTASKHVDIQSRIAAQFGAVGQHPATLHAFRRFPFLDLRIKVEGKTLARKTAFLFVGNNDYAMTGFHIGARPRLDTGKLGLYLTHRTGRWGLLRLAVRASLGRLNQAKILKRTVLRKLSSKHAGALSWLQPTAK